MLIILLFCSESSPLHCSSAYGHLEITRLLFESKADVDARNRCFSPPPFHHLSLTICHAAVATVHSNWPSTRKKPTLPHTCAASAASLHICSASARRNDTILHPNVKTYFFRVAAAIWQTPVNTKFSLSSQGLQRQQSSTSNHQPPHPLLSFLNYLLLASVLTGITRQKLIISHTRSGDRAQDAEMFCRAVG
jgi:hypothetical protein